LAAVLIDLGELEAAEGNVLEARTLLEEALVQVAELGDQRAMIRVFEVLAGAAAATGADERAVRLTGAVAGLRDRLGAPLSATERYRLEERVASAISRLGQTSSERVWVQGLGMTIEEVLQYVTTADAN
jgi:hypothetical protein